MSDANKNISQTEGRRDFMKTTMTAGAMAAAAEIALIRSAHAAGKEEIRVGLIGCGGRGSGAAKDALNADPAVKIVALADVFRDRLDEKRASLANDKNFGDRAKVPDDKVFLGFDAYKEVLKTDCDYVILATPPHFRPAHFEAAVNAGKHVFMEKPVAVDAVGCRLVMQMGDVAKSKGLSVVAGTQRRHELPYLEAVKRVRDGAIGKIVSARGYWDMGELWFKQKQQGWSDMEWQIRDWVNWCWLSGDHICEQHVHQLDVINWFMDAHPVKAVGRGSRVQRKTGDQWDNFAIDYEYADGTHVAAYCRQINGCANNVSEAFVGEKGALNTKSGFAEILGSAAWKYKVDKKDKDVKTPYVQEHVDLIDSIRNNKGLNEANNVATSTLTAVLGRIAAYSGRQVTWDEVMSDPTKLGPEAYSWDYKMGEVVIPTQGRA